MNMDFQGLRLYLQIFLVMRMAYDVFGTYRSCRTPIDDMGICVSLRFCPEVLLLYQNLPADQATQYSKLLQNICGNQISSDMYPMVCCTKPNFQSNQQTDYETTQSIPWMPSTTTKATTTTTEAQTSKEIPKIRADMDSRKSCLDRKNEIGFCEPLEKCAVLLDEIRADPSNERIKENLRYSNRICDSVGSNVCCPAKEKTTILENIPDNSPVLPPTEDEGCGRAQNTALRRIVGGKESEIGEWPWIALLGYDPYSMNPFRCGGTLITARHVLTAAHCVLYDLTFVRLGEHDLSLEDETTYVDVNIAKAIRHERYSKIQKTFDIALLHLEKKVEFTDTIYPICLPMSLEFRQRSFVSYMPYAAGWGRTSVNDSTPSQVLRDVQLLVFENQVCQNAFNKVLRSRGHRSLDISFDESVLCVGDAAFGGKDTCRGDSGGPLMISEFYKGVPRYYLIGITSLGVSCALPGVPSLYTSTQYFMDWILEKMQ